MIYYIQKKSVIRKEGSIMQTATETSRTLTQTDQNTAYDENVKKVLSEKVFLSWIMKGCVAEYKDYTVDEIRENYIEGTPKVSKVAVHSGGLIHGMDTVDKSRDEHNVFYDILFHATLPGSKEKIGLFINVEAQNTYYPGYPLIKRGIYYCSRMIAAQFNRDFADGRYEDLKKVYSIWICNDAPVDRQNIVTQYEMTEKFLIGKATEERFNYDMLSVVMVCFNEKRMLEAPENTDNPNAEKMLRLFNVLLSSGVELEEKKQILEEEYDIPMTQELDEEVSNMCNFSRGVIEKGIEFGEKNKAKQVAIGLFKRNMPIDENNVAYTRAGTGDCQRKQY